MVVLESYLRDCKKQQLIKYHRSHVREQHSKASDAVSLSCSESSVCSRGAPAHRHPRPPRHDPARPAGPLTMVPGRARGRRDSGLQNTTTRVRRHRAQPGPEPGERCRHDRPGVPAALQSHPHRGCRPGPRRLPARPAPPGPPSRPRSLLHSRRAEGRAAGKGERGPSAENEPTLPPRQHRHRCAGNGHCACAGQGRGRAASSPQRPPRAAAARAPAQRVSTRSGSRCRNSRPRAPTVPNGPPRAAVPAPPRGHGSCRAAGAGPAASRPRARPLGAEGGPAPRPRPQRTQRGSRPAAPLLARWGLLTAAGGHVCAGGLEPRPLHRLLSHLEHLH